jgi:hypothetical protein
MSEIGNYIQDDFKDIINVVHYFLDQFFGMIGYIFSFIGGIFIGILNNAKFFFGLMIPLLIIIIIFARDKKYGLILYSLIFAMVLVLLLIGVISLVVAEIDKRVKLISTYIASFNNAVAHSEYWDIVVLFFSILFNVILIILLIIAVIVIFYLIGLYQVFFAFIKMYVDREPPFVPSVSDNNNNSSAANNNSNSNSNSNNSVIDKFDITKVSTFLSGMYKSVDKRLGNPFGSDC